MDAVDHINVDVDDLDACHPFYRDVLGLEILRPPSDFAGEHAMFEAGDTVVTLAETGRAEGWDGDAMAHPLDKAHLAFETDRATGRSRGRSRRRGVPCPADGPSRRRPSPRPGRSRRA